MTIAGRRSIAEKGAGDPVECRAVGSCAAALALSTFFLLEVISRLLPVGDRLLVFGWPVGQVERFWLLCPFQHAVRCQVREFFEREP